MEPVTMDVDPGAAAATYPAAPEIVEDDAGPAEAATLAQYGRQHMTDSEKTAADRWLEDARANAVRFCQANEAEAAAAGVTAAAAGVIAIAPTAGPPSPAGSVTMYASP